MRIGKVITAEDRQMRLPWWGVLCIIFGTLSVGLVFVYFGRLELARPTILSAVIVSMVVAMRWKLKRHMWFWVTMTCLAALHAPLILFIPWTTKWVPAMVITPFGVADAYAMLTILKIVGNYSGNRDISEEEAETTRRAQKHNAKNREG